MRNRTARWAVAGTLSLAIFLAVFWLAESVHLLPRDLTSTADRVVFAVGAATMAGTCTVAGFSKWADRDSKRHGQPEGEIPSPPPAIPASPGGGVQNIHAGRDVYAAKNQYIQSVVVNRVVFGGAGSGMPRMFVLAAGRA